MRGWKGRLNGTCLGVALGLAVLLAFATPSAIADLPAFVGIPTVAPQEATGPGGANVTYVPPTATDDTVASPAVTCTPAPGSLFPIGTTPVDCAATDPDPTIGGTSHAFFNVTVQDTTPPVITVPAPITAEATSSGGAAVTYSATATDLVVGSVTPTCTPAS